MTELAPLAKNVTFNTEPKPDRRYFTNNPSYGLGDALILQAFERMELEALAIDARVGGHEQAHIVSGGVQVFEQCARHVGQTAGLGQRRHFGRDKADSQRHAASYRRPSGAPGIRL